MAEGPKPKRRLRPAQTVREITQTPNEQAPTKPKRLAKARNAVAEPFRKLGKFLSEYKVLRFIGRILLPVYIRTSWKELKLVNWPTRKESRRLTFAVLAFAIVFGALIASLDYGLSRLFKVILLGNHH